MKYNIVILAISLLFTNCNDNSPINKISNKTRDSTLLILQELYSKQNYNEAEKIIDKLPPRDEFDTKYFNIKSKIKYNCKKYTETIYSANSSLKVIKNNGALHYIIASSYLALNYPDSTLKYISNAIKYDPNNFGYLQARANLYKNFGNVVYELDDINTIIKLDTNNLEHKSLLYIYNFENGDTTSAIIGFENIIKKSPGNLTALWNLGFMNLRIGKIVLAKKYFQKYLIIEPTNGDVFMSMASILSKENKKDKSCDCLLKALEYGSREAGKHLYKCKEYFEKKGIKIQVDTICDGNEVQNKTKNI